MSALTEEMSDMAGAFLITESVVTVGAGANRVQLCAANPLRWGLILAVPATNLAGNNNLNVSTVDQMSAAQGVGLNIGSPLFLNFRSHPRLVTAAWFASNQGAAPGKVAVVEELAQQ